jgi:hypothetical protein
MKELLIYCTNYAAQYPQHAQEIMDFYQLALDEVEDGESEDHEVELCMESIQQLINPE